MNSMLQLEFACLFCMGCFCLHIPLLTPYAMMQYPPRMDRAKKDDLHRSVLQGPI